MSSKLNVCLMNDSFPPQIDGVSNAIMNYAGIIQRKYGNAVVAVPQYPDADDDYPFQVVRYPSINTEKLVGYRAGYPFSASVLHNLEKQNFDIIHSHCPIASAFLARTLRETTDAPVVLTYHTKFDIDIARAVKSELLQKTAVRFLVNNIEACDEVWAVSRGAGENLRSLGYTGEYIIMENGVDFPCGRIDDGEAAKVRGSHGISNESTVFLFVGRLMWYKGIRIILDGCQTAKERGERFRMIFVGDGADRKEIEKYVRQTGMEGECIFTGAIQDRELLRAYFCAADLFLFPSSFDTNGIVVREAAACGLASVLLAGSCAAEGIIDGQNGIFIDENTESMAAAITDACRNRDRMRDIGQNAMNQLYLSWEESVGRAYERYGSIIENHARGQQRQRVKHDEFFTAVADINDVINKAKFMQSNQASKYRSGMDRLLERFDRYL